MSAQAARLRIRCRGVVQGVGFRPFVYGLAARHHLSGFVLNDSQGVLAEVEGTATADFMAALRRDAPPLARIDAVDVTSLPLEREPGFIIRKTLTSPDVAARPGPDAVTCAACLADIFDPASRFHLYPFTTCTDCGPRFSMTGRMPYDRANTSMAAFAPCPACQAEYDDPRSRRFHAEAIACPACGPRLSHTVEAVAALLLDGQTVALKGVGGFHLLCDATNGDAVATLRRRKSRPHKPLAVMVASLRDADTFAEPTPEERALLGHAAGPIVTVRSRARLPDPVAPGLGRIGIMLPAAPVHHLVFHALQVLAPQRAPFALVATSANRRGEPLAIDDAAAGALGAVAGTIVIHDRAILARSDDSVMAVCDGKPFFIRRARGFVPDPIDLGQDGPSVLGVGGQLKATLCVTRGREAFVSQHVGDLGSAASLRFYHETARRLLGMLGAAPVLTVCDLHPDYASTRFAESTAAPLLRVQHHAAHVAAVAAEHGLAGPVLGVALDGNGLGGDGHAWGGELIELHGARWRRLGHLAPLPMPGGERAAQEPWRMGVAALHRLGRGGEAARRFAGLDGAGRLSTVLVAAGPGPETTSMGRLFDAAAALLGFCTHQTYEGQAAMQMEAAVSAPVALPRGYRIRGGVLDFTALLDALLAPGLTRQDGANLFHGTLIVGLADWIAQAAAAADHRAVALGGGCFANRVLGEGLMAALRARHLVGFLPRRLPCNDGGLSFGQAALGRAHLAAGQPLETDQRACA